MKLPTIEPRVSPSASGDGSCLNPTWTSESTVASDWTFHQIAPYIGRMKTSMARALVQDRTRRARRPRDRRGSRNALPAHAHDRCRRVMSRYVAQGIETEFEPEKDNQSGREVGTVLRRAAIRSAPGLRA